MSRLNNPRYARPRTRTDMEWREQAACRGRDPGWDSDAHVSDKRTAMRVCREECPVKDACAVAGRDEVYGIWGGVDKNNPGLTTEVSAAKPPKSGMTTEEKLAKAREVSRVKSAAETAAFLAAVERMAADGASLEDVCESLGKSSNALRQRLRKNDRNDLIVGLITNRRRKRAAA